MQFSNIRVERSNGSPAEVSKLLCALIPVEHGMLAERRQRAGEIERANGLP
jgi:hypothetical protein